jgi:hypothetical protein
MELSVGNKPNARPTSDDIERAIDETPKAADWHLHLQSNGEDSIEAFAEADGRYRVTFTEQGRRFNAASPVGADTAKAIFVDYLNGDADWRRKFRFVPEPSRGSRSRASRRISSEPPVWAIIWSRPRSSTSRRWRCCPSRGAPVCRPAPASSGSLPGRSWSWRWPCWSTRCCRHAGHRRGPRRRDGSPGRRWARTTAGRPAGRSN